MLVILLLAGGCSSRSKEPVYPVRGQVLLDGKPLAEAAVVFHRLDEQGRSLTATTSADGRFQLTSYEPEDGAPAGQYAITVEHRALVKEGDEMMRTGRNLLPARYADPSRSGLRCSVQAGRNELPPWPLRSR